MQYDLLDKRELSISPILIEGTNLSDFATVVAEVIGLPPEDVLVIDVRDGRIDLDILRNDVDPHAFGGREKELLLRLSELPGVRILEDTKITSRGMLGWISNESVLGSEDTLKQAESLAAVLRKNIQNRVMIFPSGKEVEEGQIEDTNTPMLEAYLQSKGFKTARGRVLKDDTEYIAGKFIKAIGDGFGIIITTGGVGAEDKDHSVEATLSLDPKAAVPYIVKFEHLGGRHHKPGIRIGVGQVDNITIINLPGPNDEVAACMKVMVENLQNGSSKEQIAEAIVTVLRERLRKKMHH